MTGLACAWCGRVSSRRKGYGVRGHRPGLWVGPRIGPWYCSPYCRKRGRPLVFPGPIYREPAPPSPSKSPREFHLTCPECGGEFVAVKVARKFCNFICQGEAARRRGREMWKQHQAKPRVAGNVEIEIARECLRRAQGDNFKACEIAQELTHHDRRAAVRVVEAMQTIIDQRGATQ